jgi:segregation and condensation protein A
MNYDIRIDSFEGPFDLLLDLLKKAHLEITSINIREVTSPFLASLNNMQDLNIDIAGEFLVMAATLIQMKARSLLPSHNKDNEADEPEFDNLTKRLIEYEKYKEIGKILKYKEDENSQVFYRPPFNADKSDFIIDIDLQTLADSFYNALKSLPDEIREILYQEIPIEVKMREILNLLEASGAISFNQVSKLQKSKMALVVVFIALLELIKDKQISAVQNENLGEIMIYKMNSASVIEKRQVSDGQEGGGAGFDTLKN